MTPAPDARPIASVSLDLDDLWTYLKVHGDPRWAERPSYLPAFLPRALDTFDALGLKLTVFIVGADARAPANREVLREITRRGHEVGNHSFEHDSWLHTYAPEALESDITRAEEAIAEVTGERPLGFRGPGYSWTPGLLRLLKRRGYLFDASTLPTFIGPLARWYYFRTARLTAEERHTRRMLFGRFRDGFRPLTPHVLRLGDGQTLLEIPVTTMPVTRAPFHFSYLLYLARSSRQLMRAYLQTALTLCRLGGVEPSYLLHPLDLLGADDVDALRFFPGMDLAGALKRELFAETMETMAGRFRLVPMNIHARALLARRLPSRALPASV